MLRSAHQFLKSPAEKERRDPDQPRPKDAAADRDICKAVCRWRQERPKHMASNSRSDTSLPLCRERRGAKGSAGRAGSNCALARRTIPPPFANPLAPRQAQPSASNAFLATRSCENAALRRCYDPSHETHHPRVDSADHLGQLGVDGPVAQNPPQTPIRRGNHRSAIPLA